MFLNVEFSIIVVNKRGVYFFIVDVVIGILIFLTTVLVISSFFIPSQSLSGIDQQVDILVTDFSTITSSSLPTNITNSVPSVFVREDLNLNQFIYILYLNGSFSSEIDETIDWVVGWVPPRYGFSYSIGLNPSVELYSRDTILGESMSVAEVAVSRQKIIPIHPRYSDNVSFVVEVSAWG